MENLIFLDEAGANIQMHPRYGRAYGSNRATISAPYIRGNYMTIMGAISISDIKAITYSEGAGNSISFATFIKEFLCPVLKKGDVVVMDNVSFHKSEAVKEMINATGAKLLFSPPYSPEFNPIEEMWSKIKILLRKFSSRTMKAFKKNLKKALLSVTKSDLYGWFKHAGYVSPIN